MKCPVCNVDLLMGERLGTSIDYCPQCRGIWLEKGKLDKIVEQAEASVSRGSGRDEGHREQAYGDERPAQRSGGFLDNFGRKGGGGGGCG